MVLLSLVTAALGADLRVPETRSEGTGIVDLALSGEDDRYALFVESATGQVRVLDTASWETSTFAACSGAATAVGEGGAGTGRLFVGCDDGTLTWLTVTGEELALSGASVTASTSQSILGIVLLDGTLLVVAGDANGSTFEVFAEASPGGLQDGDTLVAGTSFVAVGFEDLAISGQYAVLSQGSTFATRLTVTGAVQPNDSAFVSDLGDALSTTSQGGTLQALLADPSGGAVVRFDQTLLDITTALPSSAGLSEPTALAVLDGDLVVADPGNGLFSLFDYDESTGLPDDEVLADVDFPESGRPTELVALEGYAIASTTGGDLWVLTDRPWVDLTTSSETTVVSGTTLDLSATADVDGAWSLRLNPSGDTGGTVLESGSLTAGEAVELSVTVDDSWGEGVNQLRFVVTDSDDSTVGHDAVLIDVDSPPGAVSLNQSDVAFGDRKLVLTIPALSTSDLASFEVYVSMSEFSESDWNDCGESACGGPDWDGSTSLSTPVSVSATPGEAVEVTLSPLENDRTHYLAVRAIDEGGLEGSMSNVVTGTPTETFSASELAGEEGGFDCATVSGRAAAAGALFAGLLVLGRRRRGLAALIAVTGVGLASTEAQAVSPDEVGLIDETFVPKTRFKPQGFGHLRLGSLQHSDTNIQTVYDTSMFITSLEGGVRLTRFVEVGGGVGWSQEKGFLASSAGASSGDESRLQVIPLSATGTLRLDLLREQFLVPYVSGGLDLWLWREVWDIDRDAGTNDSLSGSKLGNHTAFGLQVLLDKLDKGRSSLIEARRGIADSYLTVEYRMLTVGESGDQKGFTFSGGMWTGGLSIAY